MIVTGVYVRMAAHQRRRPGLMPLMPPRNKCVGPCAEPRRLSSIHLVRVAATARGAIRMVTGMKRSRGKAADRPQPDRPAEKGVAGPGDARRKDAPPETAPQPPAAQPEAARSAAVSTGSDPEPLRPRGGYRGTRRKDNPWVFFLLVAATPLALVLAIVLFSALPPYTPSQAQSQATLPPLPGASRTSTVPGTGPSLPVPSPAVFVYEAEDTAHTALGTGTKLRTVSGASGGRVVTRVGHGSPAGDVTFRAVTLRAAGTYAMTVYYLIADQATRQLTLSVNGRGATVLSFTPPGAPTRIGTLRTVISLAAGTNTLRFSNATGYGPDLDRVTVGPQ